VQADKTDVATEIPFWGCPVMSFEAQLPFHGVREDFAASERDPNGPFRMILRIQNDAKNPIHTKQEGSR
jgi:hypothetical protein